MAADAARSLAQPRLTATFSPPLIGVLAALLLTFAAVPVAADVEEARRLLRKMTAANRQLDYRGVFTYEHAGLLRSVRILHLVRDGREYEKLLYLNGPPMEVIRRGVPSRCKQTGDRFLGGAPAAASRDEQLESQYELHLRGEDRVAGRRTHVIHLIPRDKLRYGYILFVDRQTNLLLQSLLVNTERRVMERFQFVDIHFELEEQQVAELLGNSRQGADSAAGGASAGSDKPDNCGIDPRVADGWKAGWLPPGFELANATEDESGVASLVYTDGVSFLSVFIDPRGESTFPEVQAQRGATVAQVSRITHQGRDYAICVVGEVPVETARRVARFIAPAER